MKFTVSSSALFGHLQAISRVINSKNALPILDCFLFEIQDGLLTITVSDSETTMVTSVEVNDCDMNGRFAVTARTLLDALKEIPEQPLAFQVNLDTLEIMVQYQMIVNPELLSTEVLQLITEQSPEKEQS